MAAMRSSSPSAAVRPLGLLLVGFAGVTTGAAVGLALAGAFGRALGVFSLLPRVFAASPRPIVPLLFWGLVIEVLGSFLAVSKLMSIAPASNEAGATRARIPGIASSCKFFFLFGQIFMCSLVLPRPLLSHSPSTGPCLLTRVCAERPAGQALLGLTYQLSAQESVEQNSKGGWPPTHEYCRPLK